MTEKFASIDHLVRELDPYEPVFCLFPEVLKARASEFRSSFPGTVLYAVKCNPHERVLRTLYDAGIRAFDTASLAEIEQVSSLLPGAKCYFNHPVKSRQAIDRAFRQYGIRDFVVDDIAELNKLEATIGTDCTVAIRLNTAKGAALFDLSAKFGAPQKLGIDLLRTAHERGMRTALTFHVGSQCHDPQAYALALESCAEAISETGALVEYLDVGGGFPAKYQHDVPPLGIFLDTIRVKAKELELKMPLLAEPGRALVAEGCSLIAQVHLRIDDMLYINDGVYGCLSETRDGDLSPPVRGIGRNHRLCGETVPFKVFGPTCDPLDTLKQPFHLPSDIQEGDWIEIGMLGAYSIALQSGFNGFFTPTVVEVEGWRTLW